jgi:hypothetical protein
MSATDLVEEALKEKLAKIKREMKEKHFPRGGTLKNKEISLIIAIITHEMS